MKHHGLHGSKRMNRQFSNLYIHCYIDIIVTSSFILVASCQVLTVTDGSVTYAPEGIPPLVGAVATYNCDDGYQVIGTSPRTCEAANDGTWTGNNQTQCTREFSTIILY